jgi:hypothetical protein
MELFLGKQKAVIFRRQVCGTLLDVVACLGTNYGLFFVSGYKWQQNFQEQLQQSGSRMG